MSEDYLEMCSRLYSFHTRRPIVCGITPLDFDHVKQLGSSLGNIAWHKAGIFKAREHCFKIVSAMCITV